MKRKNQPWVPDSLLVYFYIEDNEEGRDLDSPGVVLPFFINK